MTRDGVSPLADVEKLVIEGRYGRADLALRRLEALIPSLASGADAETLLLALYGRALLLRQLSAGTQDAIGACDVLEKAAHEREAELWVATACALRARFRVDSGDIGGATADLARADAEVASADLTSDTGYRLLDGLALVYAGLRLHDRGDEVRTRIEHSIGSRRVLDQAQHWSTWSGELAARAMEPLAGGAPDPQQELMGRAIEIAAKLDALPEAEVPATLRRGARGVRALSAAYRGRPSEALRLLGPDAFGTVGDLPLVERQVVSLAAMRAHALVGSLATARSLDDAATGTTPATLPNLVLEVCRTRERLWLETYAGGDVIPVLHRMTELLVRLGWRGMDLVADTARQALEHQALRAESRTDALTGVGNRRALDEELRQLLRFGPLPLALILVDIDHFKDVNDVFTHVIGDEVLRRVAASLSLQLRNDDQLLRYGGDEFVVLLPGTGDEEANAVAERMAAAVAARPWGELADGLEVSVTTGVAAVWSLSGRRPDADAEKLFRRADERLLDGKRSRPEESRGRSRSGLGAGAIAAVPDEPSSPPPLKVLSKKAPSEDEASEPLGLPASPSPVVDLSVVAGTASELATFGSPPADDAADDRRAAARDLPPARELPAAKRRVLDEKPAAEGLAPAAAEPVTAEPPAEPERPAATVLPVTEILPIIAPSRRAAAETGADLEDDDEEEPALGSWVAESPSRSRDYSRTATPPPAGSDRRGRAVFEPDPDIDLDAATPSPSAAPRPGSRRDGRPRPTERNGYPGHSEDGEPHAFGSVTPMRSRREARAASRPETPLHETSASRDAAEADAAAREVAAAKADEARQRATRETERIARETERLAREARETERIAEEARAAEARERVAREQAARARAAREAEARARAAARAAEAREQAEREAREQAAKEQAAREAEAREQAAREAREKAEREAEAREQAAREAREKAEREAREKAARERAAREQAAREAEARAQAAAREAEARERAAREQAEREAREAEARERAAREAEERAQAAREQAAREQAAREAESRERAAREKAAREQALREAAAREQAAREQAARERAARERAAREQAAREQAAREAQVREKAARAAAELERQRAEERARAEAEARAELQRREAEARVRAERARAERERREAEIRAAERIKQEARARAEREANAAQRIREEAYARAAEQARLAASGGYQTDSYRTDRYQSDRYQSDRRQSERYQSDQYQPSAYDHGTYDSSTYHPAPHNPEPAPPPSNPAPALRHAPLYDSNRYPEEVPATDDESADDKDGLADDSATFRGRRDPFGPLTSRQAIIDLSARKRPRNPYSS